MPLVFASPLDMTAEQRAQPETMVRSTSLPHRKVVQAKALLLATDGVGTNEVARRCGTTDDSVRAWRRRFAPPQGTYPSCHVRIFTYSDHQSDWPCTTPPVFARPSRRIAW